MRIRPLHDWAVIRRLESEEKTSGGIVIPDTAKEKPAEGIVIAIGPGKYKKEKGKEKEKKFVPTTLKPGQRVFFARYMVTEIELEGEELALVREDDIFGTVEETNQIAVKKPYEIREKPAQAVTVRERAAIAPQTAKKKEAPRPAKKVKKSAPKKKAVRKALKKTAVKRKATSKKAAKKAKKPTAGKKIAKKTAKKKAVKKKIAKKTVKKTKKVRARRKTIKKK